MDWVSDYREFTKPYILEQYKDSEKLLGLIGSVLDQCTQAEGMVQELSGLYDILTSEGIQLDIIGKIVGVARLNGETDAIYRARLLIGSHYTDIPIAEAVRALVKEATKSDRVGIYPDWPAGFYVVPEVLLDDFGNLLESMTSSGVSVTLGTWLMTEEGLYIAQEDNDCPIVVDQQPWVFKMLGALYDEETGLVICDEETGLPIYDEEFKN